LSDKAQQAMEFLQRFPGEVVKSRTLAGELDLEPNAGYYRRIVSELVDAGLVETVSGANGGLRMLP
jgi:DNA-binding IscR family transcriptional regulator